METIRNVVPATPRETVCGELAMDQVERRACLSGVQLGLTAREYALLAYLLNRVNRVVRRSEILAEIWREPDDGSNVVDVYIRRLRQKFGQHSGMIETVRGFGYKLRRPQDA